MAATATQTYSGDDPSFYALSGSDTLGASGVDALNMLDKLHAKQEDAISNAQELSQRAQLARGWISEGLPPDAVKAATSMQSRRGMLDTIDAARNQQYTTQQAASDTLNTLMGGSTPPGDVSGASAAGAPAGRQYSVGTGASGERYFTNLSRSELQKEHHDAEAIAGQPLPAPVRDLHRLSMQDTAPGASDSMPPTPQDSAAARLQVAQAKLTSPPAVAKGIAAGEKAAEFADRPPTADESAREAAAYMPGHTARMQSGGPRAANDALLSDLEHGKISGAAAEHVRALSKPLAAEQFHRDTMGLTQQVLDDARTPGSDGFMPGFSAAAQKLLDRANLPASDPNSLDPLSVQHAIHQARSFVANPMNAEGNALIRAGTHVPMTRMKAFGTAVGAAHATAADAQSQTLDAIEGAAGKPATTAYQLAAGGPTPAPTPGPQSPTASAGSASDAAATTLASRQAQRALAQQRGRAYRARGGAMDPWQELFGE